MDFMFLWSAIGLKDFGLKRVCFQDCRLVVRGFGVKCYFTKPFTTYFTTEYEPHFNKETNPAISTPSPQSLTSSRIRNQAGGATNEADVCQSLASQAHRRLWLRRSFRAQV